MKKPFILLQSNSYRNCKKILLISAGLAVGLSSCSKKKEDDPATTAPKTLSAQDALFIQKAGKSNMAEIKLGILADSMAADTAVELFGQMMVLDHGLAFAELTTLAAGKNVAIDTTLDPAHAAMRANLKTKSGRIFDSLYITGQVVDHQMTKTDLETEINTGSDQDVKNFAAKILPKVTMHLQHAIQVRDSLF